MTNTLDYQRFKRPVPHFCVDNMNDRICKKV